MTGLDPKKRPSAEEVVSAISEQPAVVSPVDAAAETVSDTKRIPVVADTAGRIIAPVSLAASKRDPWRFARRHKVPIGVSALVLAAFGFGLGLGTTFTPGASKAAGGTAHHDSKTNPPASTPAASSTTTSTSTSTTTSTTTTTTTPPVLTVERAASRLDSVIERGVANGTVPSPVAQQLTNDIQPLIAPGQGGNSQQISQQFDQLVQQFDQAVATGQVDDAATVDQIDAALSKLATALGFTAPVTTYPPGTGGPGNGNSNNGNGHGHGNG